MCRINRTLMIDMESAKFSLTSYWKAPFLFRQAFLIEGIFQAQGTASTCPFHRLLRARLLYWPRYPQAATIEPGQQGSGRTMRARLPVRHPATTEAARPEHGRLHLVHDRHRLVIGHRGHFHQAGGSQREGAAEGQAEG